MSMIDSRNPHFVRSPEPTCPRQASASAHISERYFFRFCSMSLLKKASRSARLLSAGITVRFPFATTEISFPPGPQLSVTSCACSGNAPSSVAATETRSEVINLGGETRALPILLTIVPPNSFNFLLGTLRDAPNLLIAIVRF